MTPEEIDALQVGPEMDRLVAERVFRLPISDEGKRTVVEVLKNTDGTTSYLVGPIPPYSSDDAVAMKVFLMIHNETVTVRYMDGVWQCLIGDWHFRHVRAQGDAHTFALAICRAALKASL